MNARKGTINVITFLGIGMLNIVFSWIETKLNQSVKANDQLLIVSYVLIWYIFYVQWVHLKKNATMETFIFFFLKRFHDVLFSNFMVLPIFYQRISGRKIDRFLN